MNSYKVPKELNQVDRFGKFTLPQLVIIGIAVALFMLILTSGISMPIVVALTVPIAGVALIAVYKKVYDIPIYMYAVIYLRFKSTPKQYVYRSSNLRENYIQVEDDLKFED